MPESHTYVMQKHSPTHATLSCSECGELLTYEGDDVAEVMAATIRIHDETHAERRRQQRLADDTPLPKDRVTDAEIEAWLASPEPGIWEPSFEERRGHVAVALGYVAVDELLDKLGTHPERRQYTHEVRIEDTNGRTSDHTVETHIDRMQLGQRLHADPRVKAVWAAAT